MTQEKNLRAELRAAADKYHTDSKNAIRKNHETYVEEKILPKLKSSSASGSYYLDIDVPKELDALVLCQVLTNMGLDAKKFQNYRCIRVSW